MLVTGKVREALSARGDDFSRVATESGRLRREYQDAWRRLAHLPLDGVERHLAGESWPGARPVEEGRQGSLIMPFDHRWQTAREAREWAAERLAGVPTVAVDGSQIAASKEFGVPVSLVQVSEFVNYHDGSRPYVKDLRNEIVMVDDGAEIDEYFFAESKLNRSRFALEMQTAAQRIGALPAHPSPVVFIDGSLVLSFAARMTPPNRDGYLRPLFELLDVSDAHRIPVIGYIDRSFAADVISLLRIVFDLPESSIFDAQMLAGHMAPFERTVAFQCARGDVLPLYEAFGRGYAQNLLFVYLQTGSDRPPARVDFPRWVLDAGLLEHVLDIVRAEVVAGTGYPYALETADATAVLTTEDRVSFYRMYYDFARTSGLELSFPAKSTSKARRR